MPTRISIYGLSSINMMPVIQPLCFEQSFDDDQSAARFAEFESRQAGRTYDAVLIIKDGDEILILNPKQLITAHQRKDTELLCQNKPNQQQPLPNLKPQS